MTVHIYPQALVGLRDGTLDWTAGEIKAVLLGPSFSYDSSLATLDELSPSEIIAISDVMTNPTFVNGLAFADAAAFLQLLSSQAITHVVLVQDTGDPAYSPLIAHYDSDSIIGAPKTPIGEDIFVYAITPPGGFFQFASTEVVGPINTYPLASHFSLAELSGGITLLLPSILLGSALRVHTQIVCADAPGNENCCTPTIRSSRCA